MNFYSIALKSEAEALIEKFELTKSLDKRFLIYENSDTKIIVTGMGVVNSSIATTYLLTKYGASWHDNITNIGIAGSTFSCMIGDSFLVNKVVDFESKSIITLPYKGRKLTTFSTPQSDKNIVKNSLVDMEGYGFVKSAKKFVFDENIKIIKVVSDMVEKNIPSQERVYKLIKKII